MEKMYKASYVVSYLSRKYFVSKLWVWDVMEENYNIHKGAGGIVTAAEKAETEEYIKREREAGRA